MPEAHETPTEFELSVAALYRASGAFHVEHNKLVDGNQIDVWVEEHTTAGSLVRVVVECKDYAKPVGIGIFNELAEKMRLLRSASRADRGVLVARNGFSHQARLAAESHPIQLMPFEDLQQLIQAPTRIVLADVEHSVGQARRLCSHFKDALRAKDPLASFELDDLYIDLSKLLRNYQEIMDRHRVTPAGNNEVRRSLGAIVRLEDATDQLVDALRYFRRLDTVITEAANDLPPVGRTEADYAAANSIRMRDLEQSRAQLRFRLRRLEETCEAVDRGT